MCSKESGMESRRTFILALNQIQIGCTRKRD
jgi:hypothetical protein